METTIDINMLVAEVIKDVTPNCIQFFDCLPCWWEHVLPENSRS